MEAKSYVPYDEVCDHLETHFPEFKESKEYDKENKELPHIFFDDFRRFIEPYLSLPESPLAQRFFDYVNTFLPETKVFSNDSHDVENLFAIELLTPFTLSNYSRFFTSKLKGLAYERYIEIRDWKPGPVSDERLALVQRQNEEIFTFFNKWNFPKSKDVREDYEYNLIVWNVLFRLRAGAKQEDIEEYLSREIPKYSGLPITPEVGLKNHVTEIVSWYQNFPPLPQ